MRVDVRDGDVAKAKAGDRTAFTRLIEAMEPKMYRLARSVLPRHDACADAMQEAVLRAWLKLPSLHDEARFEPWLYRIVYRECCRMFKRTARRGEVAFEDVYEAPPSPDVAECQRVRAALDALPDIQRVPLVLYHTMGYDTGDIAGILGIARGTVKTRLMRGMKRLAQLLKEDA